MSKAIYDRDFSDLDYDFPFRAKYNKKDSNQSERKFNKDRKKKDRQKARKMKKSNFIDSDSNEETKSNNKRPQGKGRDKY